MKRVEGKREREGDLCLDLTAHFCVSVARARHEVEASATGGEPRPARTDLREWPAPICAQGPFKRKKKKIINKIK